MEIVDFTTNTAERIGPIGSRLITDHLSLYSGVVTLLNFRLEWIPGRFLMAGLDWSQCPAVESVPGKVSGAWVFRGTRMPVATVFENLEDGMSIDELVETFDGLTREQIQSVLEFVAHSLEVPVPAR